MELNREQIVKALECCIQSESCEYCEYNDGSEDICPIRSDALALIKELEDEKNEVFEKGCENLTRLEEAYLKLESENLKLTKENESLKQCMEHEHASFMEIFGQYAEKCEGLEAENEKLTIKMNAYGLAAKRLAEENGRLAAHHKAACEAVKADTVRKMQSEIEKRCDEGGIYPAFVARTIDQIAKEMLEGAK